MHSQSPLPLCLITERTQLLVIDVLIELPMMSIDTVVGCVKNSLLSNLKINNYAMLLLFLTEFLFSFIIFII